MTAIIRRFGEVLSTNDVARRLVSEGAESGTVIVAASQSAGRGRSGRSWHSPDSDNLYLSYIHRTSLEARACAGITLDTGVVVAELLTRMGYEVELKWPNDVLIHGLKVAGILCELVTDGSEPVVIIGIGLNVNGDDFPVELTRVASSLFLLSHEPQDTGAIETALIRDLGSQLARYEARGAPDVERYRQHSAMVGRRVVLSDGEHAEVQGVSDDGGLVVLTQEGERVLRSGEVKFVGGTHDG